MAINVNAISDLVRGFLSQKCLMTPEGRMARQKSIVGPSSTQEYTKPETSLDEILVG
jgi:hypothetical protein